MFKPLADPNREVMVLPKPKDSGAVSDPFPHITDTAAPLSIENPSQPPQQKETENE